jgi:hypothetical protein
VWCGVLVVVWWCGRVVGVRCVAMWVMGVVGVLNINISIIINN